MNSRSFENLEFDPNSPLIQLFMPWFFHCWAPDPVATEVVNKSLHAVIPTKAHLATKGPQLDPASSALSRIGLDRAVYVLRSVGLQSRNRNDLARCHDEGGALGYRARRVAGDAGLAIYCSDSWPRQLITFVNGGTEVVAEAPFGQIRHLCPKSTSIQDIITYSGGIGYCTHFLGPITAPALQSALRTRQGRVSIQSVVRRQRGQVPRPGDAYWGRDG
jgi:hypothetical protein